MHLQPALALTALLFLGTAGAATASTRATPGQTKAQAEINLLSTVTRSWQPSRIPGLVDLRTYLLANNTQAVCRGHGTRQPGGRYARFLCEVRPLHHRPGQGLHVSYQARPNGRWEVHWLFYRRW